MKHIKKIRFLNRKGITLVWLALFMLPLLIMFAGLAIDIAYMYFTKNELQVASDAAALAGAAKLTGEPDSSSSAIVQTPARQEAWKFACKNNAASTPVFLANTTGDCNTPPTTSLNNGNDNAGDIVVGNWDGTVFTRATGSTGLSINAMRIAARRTAANAVTGVSSGNNPVNVFWGQIFRLIGINWSFLSAAASATAAPIPPQIGPFPLCLPSCDLKTPIITEWGYNKNFVDNNNVGDPIKCTDPNLPAGNGSNSTDNSVGPPGQEFFLSPSSQSDPIPMPGMAWTNFNVNICNVSPSCSTPTKNDVEPFIFGQQTIDPKTLCSTDPKTGACNENNICTTNGNITPLLKDLQDQFNKNKQPVTVGGQTITGWQVFIPIVSNLSCGTPQSTCPGDPTGKPYTVVNFAQVLLTDVVTQGQAGIRIIGLQNPVQQTFTFKCKQGGNLFTKTITRWVSSIDCESCCSPLTSTGGSSKVKLVK